MDSSCKMVGSKQEVLSKHKDTAEPECSRRHFVKTSAGVLTATAMFEMTVGCKKKETLPSAKRSSPATARSAETSFKYAMCNESMGRLSWAEQCKIVSQAGYKGIEVAPYTLVTQGVQEITPAKRREMVSTMKDAGIECAGLHWLLSAPPKGLHFTTPDTAVRQKTIAYFHQLIDFCGDLSGPYMIFGSPKQRSAVGISVEQAEKYFAESLAEVAGHAQERGVKILIEPLGKAATDVVNTLAEAFELAKRVDHPAIQIMFDFHNTTDETELFDVLLKKYFEHIHHVHVQEMDGKHLGTGTAVDDYVKAFQVLKDLKYHKWISLEVFDFSPGGKTIAEESMKALRQIESKLT